MSGRLVVVNAPGKPAILGRNWIQSIQLDWKSIFRVQSSSVDITQAFPGLFRPEVGTVLGYQAKIRLREGATPKFHRPRPVPYALQQKVEDELDRLQNEGILKPVQQSEWAAPIVIVRKGDGTIRICGDYKVTINPYLEMGTYPMPNPQDLFASLAGGKCFSRLDMKQAYQQMKVSEDSQKYLTINTSKGLFVYTRMPFGISSAPSIWQRAMDGILAYIPGVECYLDDVLIESVKRNKNTMIVSR